MKRATFILTWMTLISAMGLILLSFYWFLWPYKTIEFKNIPFPVAQTTVKAGETLEYTVDYCKYLPMSATVTRAFVDEVLFSTPPTTTNRPIGCRTDHIMIEIPKGLVSDQYTLQLKYEYKVNPLRTMIITAQSEPFTVVK